MSERMTAEEFAELTGEGRGWASLYGNEVIALVGEAERARAEEKRLTALVVEMREALGGLDRELRLAFDDFMRIDKKRVTWKGGSTDLLGHMNQVAIDLTALLSEVRKEAGNG